MKIDTQKIKEKNSIVELVQRYGKVIKNGRTTSFLPDSHNPTAFQIFEDTNSYYDYKAGRGGDVIDFIMYVTGCNFIEACKELGGEFDSRYIKRMKELEDQIDTWHKALLAAPEHIEYLHSRGITDATIEEYRLGLGTMASEKNPRIIIPHLSQYGHAIYYVGRDRARGEPKYRKPSKEYTGLESQLYGLNTLGRTKADLWTGEGYLDGLILAQAGEQILFAGSGFFANKHLPYLMSVAHGVKTLYLAFDVDDTGRKSTVKMSWIALRNHIERVRFIPSYDIDGKYCKDVNDYFCAGGNVDELKSRALSAYVFLSQNLKSLDEAEELLTHVKFLVGSVELEEIKANILKKYPAEKDLIEESAKKSKDKQAKFNADKFLKDHKILHYGDKGKNGQYVEYEFEGGYWREVFTGDIEAEIAGMNKKQIAPELVSKIEAYIRQNTKVQIKDRPQFNSGDFVNFTNGTFELETGQFRLHSPDDYITDRGVFKYDSNADCPMFKKFLDESVRPGDRQALDDLLGYLLYSDNSLERLFFLHGKAGRGKSTFLDILSELFKGSLTALTPTDFQRPDLLARLEHARVNIVDDVNANLSVDAVKTINSVVSGKTIRVRPLYQKGYEIKSRTKIILAGTDTPRLKEKEHGLMRRITFIEFCFEGQADSGLAKRIIAAELPGIFNYLYECYKDLKDRGEIRQSESQGKLKSELEQNSDRVLAFWIDNADSYEGKKISTENLFKDYGAWLFMVHNERPRMLKREFLRRFKDVLTMNKISIEEKIMKENKQTVRGIKFTAQTQAMPEPSNRELQIYEDHKNEYERAHFNHTKLGVDINTTGTLEDYLQSIIDSSIFMTDGKQKAAIALRVLKSKEGGQVTTA